MEKAVDELVAKFPVHQILFILSFGFFTVIFFPYNLSLNSINQVIENFHPFYIIPYLFGDNILIGIAVIFALSLLIGMFGYFFFDAFEFVNMHINKRINNFIKIDNKIDPNKNNLEKIAGKVPEFVEWLKKTNGESNFVFHLSAKGLSAGFLYSSEILVVFTLINTALSLYLKSSYYPQWIALTAAILIFAGIALKCCNRRCNRLLAQTIKQFDDYRVIQRVDYAT